MSVNLVGVESLPALDPLIEAYPFKSYRNYRVLSRRRQDAVLRAEMAAALGQPGGFGVLGEGAAVLVRPQPWDSAFFDLSMARLYLLHDGGSERTRPTGVEPERTRPTGVEPERTRPTGVGPERTRPTGVEPDRTRPTGVEPDRTRPTGVEPDRTLPPGVGRVLLDPPQHGESSGATLRSLLASAFEACRERRIRHLSVRVDVADASSIQALEDAGFRMMDALATYIYPLKRPAPEPIKEMGVLRLYKPDDRDQILEITREAYRGFRGRYHLDPHLPPGRSDELYVEWAKKACDGEWADVVLVTENGEGMVHGWASYKQIEPVSTVGETPIRGGGLGACRRDKPGAYAGLLRAATERIHGGGAVTEMQTQIFNFATIRLYESVNTQFVRADYTLHAWLGD